MYSGGGQMGVISTGRACDQPGNPIVILPLLLSLPNSTFVSFPFPESFTQSLFYFCSCSLNDIVHITLLVVLQILAHLPLLLLISLAPSALLHTQLILVLNKSHKLSINLTTCYFYQVTSYSTESDKMGLSMTRDGIRDGSIGKL